MNEIKTNYLPPDIITNVLSFLPDETVNQLAAQEKRPCTRPRYSRELRNMLVAEEQGPRLLRELATFREESGLGQRLVAKIDRKGWEEDRVASLAKAIFCVAEEEGYSDRYLLSCLDTFAEQKKFSFLLDAMPVLEIYAFQNALQRIDRSNVERCLKEYRVALLSSNSTVLSISTRVKIIEILHNCVEMFPVTEDRRRNAAQKLVLETLDITIGAIAKTLPKATRKECEKRGWLNRVNAIWWKDFWHRATGIPILLVGCALLLTLPILCPCVFWIPGIFSFISFSLFIALPLVVTLILCPLLSARADFLDRLSQKLYGA